MFIVGFLFICNVFPPVKIEYEAVVSSFCDVTPDYPPG